MKSDLNVKIMSRDVTRTLVGGGKGGCIFIYSCSARRVSFQIHQFEYDLKEARQAEHEYMNIHIPINVLVTSLIMRIN